MRAVILTGAGSAFSAGGNVKKMRDRTELFGGLPHQMREGYRYGIQQIPLAFYRCDVPIIAAVNGPAVGAGCDLALMCDLRVAADTAWFAESFVKLGIIPGDGGAWLLPRAIGQTRAAEMTLTGDRVNAQQALEWGLVNEVVPAADLMDATGRLAGRVAVNPPARGPDGQEAAPRVRPHLAVHAARDVCSHATWPTTPPTTKRPWRPSSTSARPTSPASKLHA